MILDNSKFVNSKLLVGALALGNKSKLNFMPSAQEGC